MDFNQAISSAYRNYLNPRGRAGRKAYWYFVLFEILLMILITVGATIIAVNLAPSGAASNPELAEGLTALATLVVVFIYVFGFGIPTLMLMVRRFHDVGLSGIYVFIVFMSGVGARIYSDYLVGTGATTQSDLYLGLANIVSLAALVVTLWPSQAGPNKYGSPEVS